MLATVGVPSDIGDELSSRLASLEDRFPPTTASLVVHGDAHTANVVVVAGRHVFIDLDDLGIGTKEIDLAPMLVASRRFDRPPDVWQAFLTAYGHDVDMSLVEAFAELRQLTMLSWLATLWNERPASHAELRHRIKTLDTDEKWNPF